MRARRLGKRLLQSMALLAVLLFAIALIDGWRAFGHRADGARRERMERSPEWQDGHFENPQPLVNDGWAMLTHALNISPHASPEGPIATTALNPSQFSKAPRSGLRVTWFGHSSILIEIDGHRILTDPVWSERVSPLTFVGPKRWYGPLIALTDLKPLDAIVISHDHYDHLDYATISKLKEFDTKFIAPLGVGAHLSYWGVPEHRITELDWWQSTRIKNLEIVCTPARHASGRVLYDNNGTLWAGYALLGATHRAYFSGDTGLFPALREIGARFGPFDLTMIEAGAYDSAWPDWHLGPEQAVQAHELVRGKTLLPIHWGLFNLAYHGWTEPIERVLAAAKESDVRVLSPKPGQSIEPEAPPAFEPWWPRLPFRTGKEDPIVSTQMN